VRDQSAWPNGRRERSRGMNPKKASTRRILRDPADGTSSHRDRRPEVDCVSSPARGRGAWNAQRAVVPERGPDRCEENALKGEARGRSSLRNEVRKVGGGRREGGNQTSDVARCEAGSLVHERIRRPGMCRGAAKPRRGSIVRQLVPSGTGGTVRGCCDGPLKGSESAWRAAVRSDPVRYARLANAPRASKRRAGRRNQCPS